MVLRLSTKSAQSDQPSSRILYPCLDVPCVRQWCTYNHVFVCLVCVFCQRTEKPDREKPPNTLASAFLGPLPSTPAGKRSLRLDTSAASDLGDIRESDMFEQVTTPEASVKSNVSSQVSTPRASPEPANALTVTDKVRQVPEWWVGEGESSSCLK